jgi:hypothetical protein
MTPLKRRVAMSSRRPAAVFVVTLIVWTATNGRTAAGDLQSGTRTASPTFEVASVKPTSSSPGPVRIETLPGGRFVATNVTLRALIQTAYRLQPFQVIGGPSWLSSDRFDIVAKAQENVAFGPTPVVFATPTVLGPGLESSIPGLHFVGTAAAMSFGPINRFVVGSWYAAPVIARAASGKRQRPLRLSYRPRRGRLTVN